MGIFRFNYRSQAYGGHLDITVVIPNDGYSYLPPEKRATTHPIPGRTPMQLPSLVPGMKFQTIYLLHGGGDDDTLVYRDTRAEMYARQNRVMLVTPSIVNSFGADTAYGVRYMTFVTEELPVLIQTLFPSSPKREDNFIMGFAMGGNAALGCALMHPHRYAACVDMSGGIGFTPRPEMLADELRSDHFKNHMKLYEATFGAPETIVGGPYDLAAVIRKAQAEGIDLPKLHMVLGEKEFIFNRVMGDYEALKKLGVDVDLTVEPGGDHDFDLWDKYIKYSMTHFFPLKRKAILPEEQ